jgi:hypothetical protein
MTRDCCQISAYTDCLANDGIRVRHVELSYTNISISDRQRTCQESGREMVFSPAAVLNIQSFLLPGTKKKLTPSAGQEGQAGTPIHMEYSNLE